MLCHDGRLSCMLCLILFSGFVFWGHRNSARKRTNPKQFKRKMFQQNLKNQKCLNVWCGDTNDAHKKPAQKRGVTLLINFKQHMRSYWCLKLYWFGERTGSAFPWTNSQQLLWSLSVTWTNSQDRSGHSLWSCRAGSAQGGGEGSWELLEVWGSLGLGFALGEQVTERCQWRGVLSQGRLCVLLPSFPQDTQGSEHLTCAPLLSPGLRASSPGQGMAGAPRARRAAPFPVEGWGSVWAEFAFVSYQQHPTAALALFSDLLYWAGTWNYPKYHFLCSLCSFIDTQILRKLTCLWAMFY